MAIQIVEIMAIFKTYTVEKWEDYDLPLLKYLLKSCVPKA